MSTTVTGKMNDDASEFAAGESTGFGIRLGVQYYDRETQQKEWTNYEGAIFAKQPAQINFYREVLRKGAIIEVSCDQLKIKSFDGQNGVRLSLEMIGAKLGYASNPDQQQGQPAQNMQQPAQGGYAQQPQQRAQQPAQGYAQQSSGAPQQMQQPNQPQQMAQQPQNQFAQEGDIPF